MIDALITAYEIIISNEKKGTLLVYRNSVLFNIAENGIERVKRYIQDKKVKLLAIYGAGKMGQIIYKKLVESIEELPV